MMPYGLWLGALLTVLLSLPCLAADPVAETHATLQRAMQQSEARARPPTIAREVFLRPPTIDAVRLSPDGRRLVFLKRNGQGADVLLQDVASGEQTSVVADVQGAEAVWSGDSRRVWLADAHGLAVIDGEPPTPKRVFKWDARRAQRFWGVDARAPDVAIAQEKTLQDGRERHRYLLIDAQGQTRLLHEAEQPLRGLRLSADGRLAFAAAYDGPRYDTVIRQYTGSGVRELLRCTGVEECQLVGYNGAQQVLWVLSQHGEDTLALQRWQEHTGRWDTVHRDPLGIADADGLRWSTAREDWWAIAYRGERRRWFGNDARTQTRLAALQRQLPEANLDLSFSADGELWLVRAQQAAMPLARHFLYRADEDRLQPLFEREDAAAQTASPEHLVSAQPISWRARDGMRLHGYVYLPRGVPLAEVPLIAWLHGGPIARNYDEYQPEIQLLANRGYAVFLPNFRVSSGYGLRYMQAARGDVGDGRVLADILDGLDALLALGLGDRDRQAVMGHSFGGYASLLAVSHAPERFRFAFAAAAPTDYGWTKQWQAEHENASLRGDGRPVALSFVHHGFPFEDAAWREKMRRESPLASVLALRAPIYLWAGAADDRVPLKSLAHYAGEAGRLGKTISLVIDPDAGHNPSSPLSLDAWLFLIERAADRHFGGGVTPPSPELQAFLRQHVRVDSARVSEP